jgi:cell division protein ZapA
VSPQPNSVSIQILGKEYKIACAEDDKQQLLSAADHLDKQMRKIREGGKVVGMERIAVMVALNLSHELLKAQTQSSAINDGSEYIKRANNKLDTALNRLKQLEI